MQRHDCSALGRRVVRRAVLHLRLLLIQNLRHCFRIGRVSCRDWRRWSPSLRMRFAIVLFALPFRGLLRCRSDHLLPVLHLVPVMERDFEFVGRHSLMARVMFHSMLVECMEVVGTPSSWMGAPWPREECSLVEAGILGMPGRNMSSLDSHLCLRRRMQD